MPSLDCCTEREDVGVAPEPRGAAGRERAEAVLGRDSAACKASRTTGCDEMLWSSITAVSRRPSAVSRIQRPSGGYARSGNR